VGGMDRQSTTFAVVTLSTANIFEFAHTTESTKRRYARRHGYQFLPYREKLDERHPAWSKVLALLDAFDQKGACWYFWVDADAMILNHEIKLESMVSPHTDLVISEDKCGLNSGSFLIKRNPRTRKFLQTVYQSTEFIDHGWWDQAAIRDVIRRGAADISMRFVPQRALNSYFEGSQSSRYTAGDFVLHLAGLPPDHRVKHANFFCMGFDFKSEAQFGRIVRTFCPGRRIALCVSDAPVLELPNPIFSYPIRKGYILRLGRAIRSSRSERRHDVEPVDQFSSDPISAFKKTELLLGINALKRLPENSIDVAYIDLSYSSAARLLPLIYAKVRSGGILTGSGLSADLLCDGRAGAREAIRHFLQREEIDFLFATTDGPSRWFTVKENVFPLPIQHPADQVCGIAESVKVEVPAQRVQGDTSTEADQRFTHVLEYGGGLGDVLCQCFGHGSYGVLDCLEPKETACVNIISHNPFARELFDYHPKIRQISVRTFPYWTPEQDPVMRHKYRVLKCSGLPERCPFGAYAPSFHCAPSDLEQINALKTDRYAAIAISAGLPERDLPIEFVKYAAEVLVKNGFTPVYLGRTYERLGRAEISPRQFPGLNLLDKLTVPGTGMFVQKCACVISAHSAVGMLAWLMRRPNFQVYPASVRDTHLKNHDQWAFGFDYSECFHCCSLDPYAFALFDGFVAYLRSLHPTIYSGDAT